MHELGKKDKSVEAHLEDLNNTAQGIFIQLTRIYDLLAAQAAGANEQQVVGLLNMHEAGLIFTEPPALRAFGARPGAETEEESSDAPE